MAKECQTCEFGTPSDYRVHCSKVDRIFNRDDHCDYWKQSSEEKSPKDLLASSHLDPKSEQIRDNIIIETNNTVEPHSDFALDSLEELRKRLLDLTGRNRLLNFTHPRMSSVRVIDELPNQLYEQFIDEKEMRFVGVPEPTRNELIEAGYIVVDEETKVVKRVKDDPKANEWAKWLGLVTSYELPHTQSEENGEKHQDKNIQTLMFPYEMEAKLRNIYRNAKTAIEETGANILYLAFGFLEWYDSPDSDRARLAPLHLIPVQLNRGKLDKASGTYNFTLNYTGEDIIPNLSLREKMKIDFGLNLPSLDATTIPEDYFKEIQDLFQRNQPRWKLRRYCSLALLNFSKLLMYLDLDPQRWLEGGGDITTHPVIQHFFSSSSFSDNDESQLAFNEEYEIDNIPDIHEHYPLIDDADSSQHSAIIDAVKGKNLVIEGPPGTGKSQTITNLIAAAIGQGKKVLFVAEKLAALEVVKRRLDNAGLGDFCLELHSHKTQKNRMLDDINRRLSHQNTYQHPTEIDADIARYEQLKVKLQNYAGQINETWKNTGKTIHQILMAATRFRDDLPVAPTDLHPSGISGEIFTTENQRIASDTISTYERVYKSILVQLDGTELSAHPWIGVENINIQLFDEKLICQDLSEWQESLHDLLKIVHETSSLFNTKEIVSLEEVTTLLTDLKCLSALNFPNIVTLLPRMRGDDLNSLEEHIDLTKDIAVLQEQLTAHVSLDLLNDLDLSEKIREAHDQFQRIGVSDSCKFDELAKLIRIIEVLQTDLTELNEPIDGILSSSKADLQSLINPSELGLQEYLNFLHHLFELKPQLLKQRNDCFDNDELDDLLPKLKVQIENLNKKLATLAPIYNLEIVPSSIVLLELQRKLSGTNLFSWFSGEWRGARKKLLSICNNSGVKFAEIHNSLERLIITIQEKEKLDQEQLFFKVLGENFKGLKTDIDEISSLRSWYKKIRTDYGVGFGPKVPLAELLLTIPYDFARGLISLKDHGLLDKLTQTSNTIIKLKKYFGNIKQIKAGNIPLVGKNAPLDIILKLLEKFLQPCQQFVTRTDLSLSDLADVLGSVQTLQELSERWQAQSFHIQKILNGEIFLHINCVEDCSEELSLLTRVISIANIVEKDIKTSCLQEALYTNPNIDFFLKVQKTYEKLDTSFALQNNKLNQFSDLILLNFTAWTQHLDTAIQSLIARNNHALENSEWLTNWLDLIRIRSRVSECGFGSLVNLIENKQLSIDQINPAFRLGAYDLLSREILMEKPELAQFSGQEQTVIQSQFCSYDEKLKKLQQKKIAWKIAQNDIPQGQRGGKVATYTDLSLIVHECGKKKRHIPIRQLVNRAGQALLALKPCFMMGPMSVAQYLEPGSFEFDLVVMDEASQIKPQDALGAIARGKQLIVVGDPKQLPPTSFFDKIIDDEGEDNTAIEESESILDAAIPMFSSRRLRWHYRSQHESLIAFSNYSFYDNDLVVFPSPHSESADYGVKFTKVHRGRFIKRRNIEEATVIAEAVSHHILNRPQESLGVVAMSAEQREQIERAMESLGKEHPLLRDAIDKNRGTLEPLFIKNLENVQGDERDVIFISCTYGPAVIGGKVPQRFGPINSDVGWRRLNVLFTRSKKRMHVFSSMGAEDILISPTSKRGVKALKDFLGFVETGNIYQPQNTGREPDSDFEISVINALQEKGYECEAQVGVAGFFIDLAVKDPGKPGRYLMGVECDGASYHSAKSARDRDRLRQDVLERLGWRIRRIWSTDWFKNPHAELIPIFKELDELKTDITELDTKISEQSEIIDIVEHYESEEENVESLLVEDGDLEEKLRHFNRQVIKVEYPDTPDEKRLLRPGMLEALLEFRPTTVWEFQQEIPPFLRMGTDPNDGKFLQKVIDIIREEEGE